MKELTLEPNLPEADEFYASLVALHDGLDAAQSLHLNAKLILLLANQIGDARILREILALARAQAPSAPS